MSLKHRFRKLAQRSGLDVRRYPADRIEYSRNKLLRHHGIGLVLDVGANAGQYGSELRDFGYSGRLVSFEPLPCEWQRLAIRASADPLWETHQCALGDRHGIVTLNVAANGGASSSILTMLDRHTDAAPDARYIGTVVVEQFRLDDIAEQYVPPGQTTLLKIDVQGYEERVLRGAERLLTSIRGIQIEMSFVPLYEGGPLYDAMFTCLRSLGYRLEWLSPGFTDEATGQMLQADALFFREG